MSWFPPPLMQKTAWHTRASTDVLALLHSNPSQGLSAAMAAKALEEHGRNELASKGGVSPWKLLFQQFQNILVIILLLATGVSAVLGHEVEAISIAIIVLFAVLLGFIQEYRAERAIESLKKMAAPMASVLRDGQEQKVPTAEVVPGDILILRAGDRVCADARIVESVNLQADEASLTGESLPVPKAVEAIPGDTVPLGDRRNMVYAGTAMTYGRGTAVVTSTGMGTELGTIAGLLEGVEATETPLQQNLDKVGKTLAKAGFLIVAIIAAVGLLRGEHFVDVLIFGIALAVAVVPEALPAVVTISLAIGVQRMVRRHALVRRLSAVEALGSTTIICSDKTGTLTKDEMTIRRIHCAGTTINVTGVGYAPKGSFEIDGKPAEPPKFLLAMLTGGMLACDATVEQSGNDWEMNGDPTEGAIVTAAMKAGLKKNDLSTSFPRTAEIPFTSETKRMITLHATPGGTVAYAKGAPEVLLSSCTHELTEDGDKPLSEGRRAELLAVAQGMAKDALRVLAVARRDDATLENAPHGLTLLGLVGMIDPPRLEVRSAVATCKTAGIRVVMITGDHPVTAEAVARELGIANGGRTVTGPELSAMSDADLERDVSGIDVFARVAPEHKLRVVTALQKNGHIAAMTGDGVNDAPALKKADVGVAMGITGTDVSKEAAAIILTDDNFASIVAAVEEGRGIFGNIKKYLMYLLSSNIGEILIMTVASVFGLPMPLSAVQILFVNLATDGLPALALAVDPPDEDLMVRPPRNPRASIFTPAVLSLLISGGVWSMVVNLFVFLLALRSGKPADEAMTMTFTCLILVEFFKAFSFRSDRHSVFVGTFANRWLNLAVLSQLALLLVVIYVPFFHVPLGTFSLTVEDWMLLVPAAITIIPVLEIAKWVVPKIFGDGTDALVLRRA